MNGSDTLPIERSKRKEAGYFTREEVHAGFTPGSWQRVAFAELEAMLLSDARPFPCMFGVNGFKTGQLRFAFLGDLNAQDLAEILRGFLPKAQNFGKNTSLVVFSSPENIGTIEQYRERFWSLLRDLNEADTVAWPSEVPIELDNPNWEFCFNGESIFVVCNTPAHIRRQSRRSSVFTVTFQPRWVFETILGTERSSRAAFHAVSERLSSFDMVPKSPVLGRYGDPAVREWKQYFLDEENSESECPFHKLASKEATK